MEIGPVNYIKDFDEEAWKLDKNQFWSVSWPVHDGEKKTIETYSGVLLAIAGMYAPVITYIYKVSLNKLPISPLGAFIYICI